MNLDFDLGNIRSVIFGVGRDDAPDGEPFVQVPVGGDVQEALQEMLGDTWGTMQAKGGPQKYAPSEKHASVEFLYLPRKDGLCISLSELHDAVNLSSNTNSLDDPENIYSYFAQYFDGQGKKITALRRASQFKGVLKCQNRLMRLIDDSLEIVADNIFKLDRDFDLLIDEVNIFILRPSGFEFAGKLQQAIQAAVPGNVARLSKNIEFVDFDSVQTYASEHPRAARYLASILNFPNNDKITLEHLVDLCGRTGVDVKVDNGRIKVTPKHELAFLEVLDRRRYEVDLTEESPEQYRAASRSPIAGS